MSGFFDGPNLTALANSVDRMTEDYAEELRRLRLMVAVRDAALERQRRAAQKIATGLRSTFDKYQGRDTFESAMECAVDAVSTVVHEEWL